MPDYDDPAVEEKWCAEQRITVEDYLRAKGVEHGRIGEWPAWHVAPYVSIWAVESKKHPEWIGWWVISGDLPTDYISAGPIRHPREAMRAFARCWIEYSEYMARGEAHPNWSTGPPADRKTLVPLLKSRAEMLSDWAGDDSMWEEE